MSTQYQNEEESTTLSTVIKNGALEVVESEDHMRLDWNVFTFTGGGDSMPIPYDPDNEPLVNSEGDVIRLFNEAALLSPYQASVRQRRDTNGGEPYECRVNRISRNKRVSGTLPVSHTGHLHRGDRKRGESWHVLRTVYLVASLAAFWTMRGSIASSCTIRRSF